MEELKTAPAGLVDRVAKAVDPDAWSADYLAGTTGAAARNRQGRARDKARAAIEAMRGPITMDMRAAAVNVADPGFGEPPLYEKIWQAMIDAALSERSERS